MRRLRAARARDAARPDRDRPWARPGSVPEGRAGAPVRATPSGGQPFDSSPISVSRASRACTRSVTLSIAAPRVRPARPRDSPQNRRNSPTVRREKPAVASGRNPIEDAAAHRSATTSQPSIRALPSAGRRTPASNRIVVVLPAPFRPRNAHSSPRPTPNDNRSTTVRRPNRIVSPSASIIARPARAATDRCAPPLHRPRLRPIYPLLPRLSWWRRLPSRDTHQGRSARCSPVRTGYCLRCRRLPAGR